MIKDNRSGNLSKLAMNEIINSDTTTTGAIIDTADYDSGTFTILSSVYNAGTYTPILYESADSGMSGATAVADANLIGTEAGAALSAVTADGASLVSFGVFGTLRYLRLSMVSVSSTTTTIIATFTGGTLVSPSGDLSA